MAKLNFSTKVDHAKTFACPPSWLPESVMDYISRDDIVPEIFYFDSLSDFINFIELYKDFRHKEQNSSMRSGNDAVDFTGTKNFDEFIDILKNGDEEIKAKVRDITANKVKELEKKYDLSSIKIKQDVSGNFFDVGMLLEGIPESWFKIIDTKDEKKAVQIFINISSAGRVDKDEIINNAAHIISIAKILEKFDVLVDIKIIDSSKGFDNENINRVRFTTLSLKRYDETFDYNKISAVLHPSFLRRGMFKFSEVTTKELSYGYGSPINSLCKIINLNNLEEIENFESSILETIKGE